MKITKSQLKQIIKEELNEVYSEKQRRWACAQTGDDFKGERSLTKKEAEEMCKGPMKEGEIDESNLFQNIRAKRARGETPAKPGDEDYPDEKSWKKATMDEAERLDKEAMACNKPKRTPKHPKKSHVVKACEDGKEKIIRFGEQGAETAGGPKKGESERMKKKRKSFKARHRRNIKKGKMSAAYWADKVKW